VGVPTVPDVHTGGAAGSTAHGAVDPENQPTQWYFEYGPTAAYGAIANGGSLPGDDSLHQVAAELPGLVPGRLYHYRLVAANTHGITTGRDRTFRTPGRAAATGTVTGLRVKPGKFRRGRSANIRFKLSTRATVTLTFERRTRRGWKRVRGSVTKDAPGGWTKDLHFTGRVRGRMLKRGRYRIRAAALGSTSRARFALR